MATENILQLVSRQAGTNVTNKRFVVEVAGGIVNRNSVAGGPVDGVCAMVSYGITASTITAGDEVPVAKSGDVIVESGALVNDGDEVMSDNVGRAVPFVADGASVAVGKVVNGSSASAAAKDLTVELYGKGQHAGELIS